MITLIDNDIILKMGKWDLFNELVELSGGDLQKIYHLSTCVYALCSPKNPQKGLKRCGNQEAIDRIKAFCDATKPIPEPNDLKWLEMLNGIPAIDVGEVLIFATGIEKTKSITYIGDKRSLIALAESHAVVEAFTLLCGRIKCLEQVTAEMIARYGCLPIGTKLRSCQADKAIAIVVGSARAAMLATEIWDGLVSYYSDLNERTGGLLAPFPDIPDFISNEQRMEAEVLQTN